MKHYNQSDTVNWLEEYKERYKAGLEAQRILASFSKRFFSEHVRLPIFLTVALYTTVSCYCCSLLPFRALLLTIWLYARIIKYFGWDTKVLPCVKAICQLSFSAYFSSSCIPGYLLKTEIFQSHGSRPDAVEETMCRTTVTGILWKFSSSHGSALESDTFWFYSSFPNTFMKSVCSYFYNPVHF